MGAADVQVLEKNVERGMAWLDENFPGWFTPKRIDLKKLQMENTGYFRFIEGDSQECACVFSQVTQNDYFKAEVQWNLHHWFDDEHTIRTAWMLGFTANDDAEYPKLTTIWKRRILERRAQHDSTPVS